MSAVKLVDPLRLLEISDAFMQGRELAMVGIAITKDRERDAWFGLAQRAR